MFMLLSDDFFCFVFGMALGEQLGGDSLQSAVK